MYEGILSIIFSHGKLFVRLSVDTVKPFRFGVSLSAAKTRRTQKQKKSFQIGELSIVFLLSLSLLKSSAFQHISGHFGLINSRSTNHKPKRSTWKYSYSHHIGTLAETTVWISRSNSQLLRITPISNKLSSFANPTTTNCVLPVQRGIFTI